MSDEELAAIEARANAATKGPWFVKLSGYAMNRLHPVAIVLADTDSIEWTEADYTFVAEARKDIPALLAHVRELRAVVDRLNRLEQDDAAAVKEAAALRTEVEQLRREKDAWQAQERKLREVVKDYGDQIIKRRKQDKQANAASGEPVAWLVYCPEGHEHDSLIHGTRAALEDEVSGWIADELVEADNPPPILPLYTSRDADARQQLAAATARAEQAEGTLDEVRDCLRSADFQLAERLLDYALAAKGESK